MRDIIERKFRSVFERENTDKTVPAITDNMVLLESGLDSLGFAVLVVELEEELGFDPFTLSEDAYYPQTFGEFVAFYESNKP